MAAVNRTTAALCSHYSPVMAYYLQVTSRLHRAELLALEIRAERS